MTVNNNPTSPLINPRTETVCVTGASGFIGSWLVLRLLQRGYTVRGTVRDPSNAKKVKHLEELPNAKTNLTLWKADMGVKGSYDKAILGCTGVFHVATPMFFETDDPENDMIKPTVEGMVDIMRSCIDSGTVKRLIFTSSAGTVDQDSIARHSYDETCWSNVEYCRDQKLTGWMYFVSKTMAEKAAWAIAKERNFDFVTVIPTLVVGPFLNPEMPPSLVTALSLMTGNEAHYGIIKQGQFVHLDDLCEAHIFLYENPESKGRYICSSNDATIFQIAKLLQKMYPEFNIPTKFKGVDERLEVVSFSSKKLRDLGFEFKYGLEDMFKGAVESCMEKGLSLSK